MRDGEVFPAPRHPGAAGGRDFSRFPTRSVKVFTNRRYILSNAAKHGPAVFATRGQVESRLMAQPSSYLQNNSAKCPTGRPSN